MTERIDAIRQMYAHGRGRVVMRAQVAFEETRRDRIAIIVTELPYQVNKAALIEKIADLVKEKRLEGIADLRDESDRDGMRIYIEVKRDANPHKVLNNLFKHTPMQIAFNLNMLALVDGQPQTLPLKAVLQHHIDYRREVIRRRTEYDLGKARERAHILEGLKIALDNLDAVIRTIRESADVETARTNLMTRFELSEIQAQAILDMRLARLAALERKKIEDEYLAVIQLIAELEDILANPGRVLAIIKDELRELKRKYAGERRTRVADDASREMTDEDLIADEDVVVTISGRGYIKRQPVATYRRQHRGGKGIIGHVTREEDAVEHLLVANTHDWALFFTNRGRVFSAKVHAIPDASRQAKGIPIINLPGVQVESGEVPMATIIAPRTSRPAATSSSRPARGSSRRRRSSSSRRSARRGIIAHHARRGRRAGLGGRHDAATTTSSSPPPRASSPASPRTRSGRWAATRPASSASGSPAQGDQVVSMSVVEPTADLLVLTETGYGKRVPLTEFRRKHRGGQGVRLISLEGRKTGAVAAVQQVTEADEELLLISGRRPGRPDETNSINRYSSGARGVIVMRLDEGDRVVGIAAFRAGLAERAASATMTARGATSRRPTAVEDGRVSALRSSGRPPVYADQFDIYTGNANPELARKICRYLGDRARAGRGLPVRQREHLRQDPRQRPREGRLPRPADLPPGEPVDHGAADHDRRLQAGERRPDHRRRPVLRLRPVGQEGPAARPDHAPASSPT